MPEVLDPEITDATLAKWVRQPQVMVRELFGAEPDPWQDECLASFPTTDRLAMKASKGPGKTALLAWCAWNFLITRPHPNIAATSISGANLRDNLWKEMAHWRNKSPFLQRAFEWQAERIFARAHPATWFMTARTWSASADPMIIGNTLAGLHSDYIMFLIDESGSIHKAITMSAEAAFSSAKECHILQAGNTNMLEGALYDACVLRPHLWRVINITGDPSNPMRSSRVSIAWAQDMIDTYGRDDPFVKVMVLGEWPASSVNALLGPEDIQAAMDRKYQQREIEHSPRVVGVDVGRQGDDASVIFPRQGLVAFPPKILRNVTGMQGATELNRMWSDEKWPIDGCLVDATGGFGWPWIEALEGMNRTAIPIAFSGKASSPRYANKRAEIYFLAAEWIKTVGALPDCPELIAEFTQTTYTHKGDALLLEPKEVVKKKIGRSPDRADALCLTFAEPIARSVRSLAPTVARRPEPAYDPFEEFFRARR